MPKKSNFICLVTHWNLFNIKKWNFRIFSISGFCEIWLKFFLNILHIRAFFPNFFHIEIGTRFPQNGKKVECTLEKHIFPKFSLFFGQKCPKQERNHYFIKEEIILFRSNFVENLPKNKITATELICIFTNNFSFSCKSQCPHILDQTVVLCTTHSVAQYQIILWFLV